MPFMAEAVSDRFSRKKVFSPPSRHGGLKAACNKFASRLAGCGLYFMQARGGEVVSACRARAEQLLK
jgi:hypothetical protein